MALGRRLPFLVLILVCLHPLVSECDTQTEVTDQVETLQPPNSEDLELFCVSDLSNSEVEYRQWLETGSYSHTGFSAVSVSADSLVIPLEEPQQSDMLLPTVILEEEEEERDCQEHQLPDLLPDCSVVQREEEVEETCPAEAQEHEQGNLLDFVSITMGKDEEEEAEETCPAEAPSSTSVETVPALEDKGDSAKEKATKHSHAKESAGKKAQLLRSIQEAKEKRAAAKERIEAIKHRAGAEVPTTTPQSKVEKMPENDVPMPKGGKRTEDSRSVRSNDLGWMKKQKKNRKNWNDLKSSTTHHVTAVEGTTLRYVTTKPR